MPSITPAVSQLRLDALRACAVNPQGLRGNAYPSVMSVLEAAGLVTRRSGGSKGRQTLWFLTPAGREVVAGAGVDTIRKDRPE